MIETIPAIAEQYTHIAEIYGDRLRPNPDEIVDVMGPVEVRPCGDGYEMVNFQRPDGTSERVITDPASPVFIRRADRPDERVEAVGGTPLLGLLERLHTADSAHDSLILAASGLADVREQLGRASVRMQDEGMRGQRDVFRKIRAGLSQGYELLGPIQRDAWSLAEALKREVRALLEANNKDPYLYG